MGQSHMAGITIHGQETTARGSQVNKAQEESLLQNIRRSTLKTVKPAHGGQQAGVRRILGKAFGEPVYGRHSYP